MSGFTVCIGREARGKQKVAGRMFAQSWHLTRLRGSKEAKLSMQKNAEEFLVAARYLVEAAASSSTGNEGTQEVEAELAYATASAAASPAGDAAAEDAFWKVLADDVMEHLVWPAVRKCCIHAAPGADVEYPEWWERGILPILQHPRVYMLHCTGCKKAEGSCWTFVCEQLANHVFVQAAAGEAFTQKTCRTFALQQDT